MADGFDPGFEGALGALAFVMGEMSTDELRGSVKLLEEMAATEGWVVLCQALEKKREAVTAGIMAVDTQYAQPATYAKALAHAEALLWPSQIPGVFAVLAERKEAEDAQALKSAPMSAGRE